MSVVVLIANALIANAVNQTVDAGPVHDHGCGET
jgi:hypothetical protein